MKYPGFLLAFFLWTCMGPVPAYARYHEGDEIFAWGFAMVAGIFLFFWGFGEFRKKRAIQDIPTSTIRAMAPGLVEIVGDVVDWRKVKAPFSREDCVYYEYKVEEYVRRGKHSSWVTVQEDNTGTEPIFLDDRTGKVGVLPKDAEVIISDPWELTTGMFTDIPPHIDTFLGKKGISCRGFFGFEKKLRFTEKNFKPGERLYAMGTCRSAAGMDLAAPKGTTQDSCLAKGEVEDEYFILSDESQKDLIGKFDVHAFLGVFGGMALFFLGFIALMTSLGYF